MRELNRFKELRKKFHQLAEPSGLEKGTASLICEELEKYNPYKIHTFDDSYSVLAEFHFSDDPRTVLIRGDIDAVNVKETLSLTYASFREDVSHKCGHDGHIVILLEVARELSEMHLPFGRVLLFFQAEEESGQGACKLLQQSILSQFDIVRIYGFHNIPGFPINSIICREESFTCSVISCDIAIEGRTAHAAEPENGISPIPAALELLESVAYFNQPDVEQEDYCLVTPIEVHLGEKAYGVAAGSGVIRLTIRTNKEKRLNVVRHSLEEIISHIESQTSGLRMSIDWLEHFVSVRNNPSAVAEIVSASKELGLQYMIKQTPFTWGEDFGFLTQKYSGAMFGIGAGESQPPLHHSTYDFPDEIGPVTVALLCRLIQNFFSE